MKLIKDMVIQNKAPNNRQILLNLQREPNLGIGKEIVYIYSLMEDEINYPKQKGKIIYIGEALRNKEATGKRFQHIFPDDSTSNNYVGNYTITQYYNLGYKLNLKIYELDTGEKREDMEHILSTLHLQKYGSRPIANGSTGQYSTPKYVEMIFSGNQRYYNLV
ncbi:hypothetical protein [Niallia sp. Krafla_26]|uniref:hypothetical protein n=1 Tax=Niallia sp. Krafla_26 TaxID=3064703 RepID=UPI003D185686